MQKYKLIDEPGTHLKRLVALRDFSDIKAEDLGGLIEQESNLSPEGNCWIYKNATVYGNARVYGDAGVSGDARVSGTAKVFGDAMVYGNARVYGDAEATVPVLTAQLTRHHITVTDNHITIGCEIHTFEEWLSDYKEIGKKNNYSKEDIAIYLVQIKLFIRIQRKQLKKG